MIGLSGSFVELLLFIFLKRQLHLGSWAWWVYGVLILADSFRHLREMDS